jgi:dTMP kinase
MHGRLIAFEGIDGCGKSTQARLLFDRLGSSRAILTSEPGATELGASLRRILLDPNLPPVSPESEALLLCADRAEHVRDIVIPALNEGLWVISDRYSGSTLAYQGYGRGLDLVELEQLVRFATRGLAADLNVLIEVPLEVARKRLEPSRPDRLEQLEMEFHERVAAGYDLLASSDRDRWAAVDGTSSPERIAESVFEAIELRLGELPGTGESRLDPSSQEPDLG